MALYARLLGASWLQLAEPVRSVHATPPTMHARGRLRIEHGRSHLARFLARLLRLPRASEAAETPTRQYQAAAGELAERFGVLEFRFRLDVSEGSLLFRQLEAAFLLGSVRLPLPATWAPRVDAREDPAGARQIKVHVRVALPALGPVLTYDGTIDIEDTHA